MLKADDFRIDKQEIAGWPVNITSYKIGKMYYCHVDNVDPGTTIARVEGEGARLPLLHRQHCSHR